MAMTNVQIEKRLRQHDNEIVAIYDLLAEIRTTVDGHTRVLSEHTQVLAEHTQVLGQHTHVLAEHTQVLTEQTQVLGGHTGMLTEILRRLPEAS